MWLIRRRKYIAYFVIIDGVKVDVIGRRTFRPTQKKIKLKGGSFPVNVSTYTYRRKHKTFYLFDFKGGQQMYLIEGEGLTISPEALDMVLSQSVIKQLVAGLSVSALNMFQIIIGIIAGVGLGWVIRDLITGGYFG